MSTTRAAPSTGVRRFTSFTAWMTVDLRALGAFRIALAFTILVDLLDRARSFDLYTPGSPLPVGIDGFTLTFHRGPPALIAALFVVHALVAVAFGVGARTRIAGIALFVLQLSLQQRCYIGNYLGDDLLRSLLFWACVLPVGARFSVDSGNSRAPGALRSFAAGGLTLVPVVIFLFTALEKLASPVWRNAGALESFVDSWIYPTTIGVALLENVPYLFAPMTAFAIVAEVAFPLMLLSGWWRVRLFGAAGLFALMFGIALMLDVGLFPLITATALIPLLPTAVWSRGIRSRGTPVPTEVDEEGMRVHGASSRPLDLVALGCALCMIVTSAVNMAGFHVPQPVGGVLKVMGLNQRWPMFIHPESAPRGWFLVAGKRMDGSEWDLLQDAPLAPTYVPAPMSTVFTFRERRVLARSYVGGDGYEESTAAWLCNKSQAPLASISVGYADVRGDPPTVLVIEIVKNQMCPPRPLVD